MKILIILLIITFQSHSKCFDQLNNYITGFKELQSQDFTFLDGKLTNVKIVGYGEDTHGSAEFTLLSKELMQYLNEKHEFSILIIETGFAEGLYFNDYIQGKRDDIENLLNNTNSTWRYRTKEFLQLMYWLRKHNKTSKNKILLYGSEMQYVRQETQRVQRYLKTIGSDYKIVGFEKHLWQNISNDEKKDYSLAYHKLKKHFDDNEESFKQKSNEYSINYHQVEIIGQFVFAINQENQQLKNDLRDIYMANNVQWILNNNLNKKALFWAHNAHIGDWVSNGIVDVAGHFLRKRYAESYYNIATDFGAGEFLAFSHDTNVSGLISHSFDETDENTFTNCIKKQGTPNAYVNLRDARKNPNLDYYLSKPLKIMYGAGANEWGVDTQTVDIGKAFDGIIYIDKVHKINRIIN